MIDFAGISEYNEFDTLFCLREYRKAHQMRYFRNAMRNVTDIFSFIYEIDKSIFSILACSVLLTGLAVLPAMYLPKQILDEFADGRDYGKVAGYALIFAALDLLSGYNIYKMIDGWEAKQETNMIRRRRGEDAERIGSKPCGRKVCRHGVAYLLLSFEEPCGCGGCFSDGVSEIYDEGKCFLRQGAAWLLRVTINACKDYLKSFFRRNVVSLEGLKEMEAQMPGQHREVLEAVLSLPGKYKDVIYLHYYEGYSAAEIGRILGKKENTVYSLLSRGRGILKEKLGGDGFVQ